MNKAPTRSHTESLVGTFPTSPPESHNHTHTYTPQEQDSDSSEPESETPKYLSFPQRLLLFTLTVCVCVSLETPCGICVDTNEENGVFCWRSS